MAISNSDGSIILTTELDTTGLRKDIASLKSSMSNISGLFKKVANAVAATFSVKALVNFSREASNLADKTEASAQRIIDIYGEASKAVNDYIDANARALGMAKNAATQYAAVYGNLFSAWADASTNAELTTRYLNMTAVVASKTGRTIEDVQERIRSGLLGNTEAIEDLGIFVNVNTIQMTEAFKRMANGKSWAQLDAYTQQQIRAMAILEQSTAKYGTQVADTAALAKSRFSAAFEDFKATWGQVINQVLVPVLEVLTDILTAATDVLTAIFGFADASGDSVADAADNQKQWTKETEKTAKAQQKLLAGFDDLQILSGNTSGAAGTASTGTAKPATTEQSPAVIDLLNTDLSFSELIQKVQIEYETPEGGVEGLWDWAKEITVTAYGQLEMRDVINADAAIDKFKISFAEAMKEFKIDFDLTTFSTKLYTKTLTSFVEGVTAGATTASGTLDVAVGIKVKDPKNVWEGIGKIIQGGMSAAIAGYDLLGLDSSVLKKWFYPEEEEFPNPFTGLSVEAAEALNEVNTIFDETMTELYSELGFGLTNNVVTEDTAKTITDNLSKVWTEVKEQANAELGEQLQNIKTLYEGGFITEDEANEMYARAQGIYQEQDKLISQSEEKIKGILEKAKEDNRALTQEEADELQRLLDETHTAAVQSIQNSANNVAYEQYLLSEKNAEWSKSELSALIKHYDDVYQEEVKAADAEYLAQVEAINNMLGLSDQEKADMLTKAKELRDSRVAEAETTKNDLVSVARAEAGEIASFVDPDTGEIYSNWEVTWNNMFTKVEEIWGKIENFFNTIVQPLFTVLKWFNMVKDGANGMIDGFENAVNGIIELFEKMGGKIVTALNNISFDIPEWFPVGGGEKFGFNLKPFTLERVKVPRLAQGAVIPPNKEFLAVLGDQRQGTNIETPLETMVEAFKIALDSRENSNGSTEIVLEIDGRQFGRAVVEQGKRESRRIGTRLVTT